MRKVIVKKCNKHLLKMNFIVLILILIIPFNFSTVILHPNGQYEIDISLQSSTQPSNFPNFLRHFETLFQGFSEFLWSSTLVFSIRSVNLIVPLEWNTDTEVPIVSMYEFQSAPIKISDKWDNYRVENPGICGKMGNFLKIPWTLFDKQIFDDSDFKALLNLWARYRWGVWEEHGYPGDLKLPYFIKNPTDDGWTINGCSDTEVTGEIRNLNIGESCTLEDPVYPPESDCRFLPHETQIDPPTSSLMHLHWISSVEQFCTSDTHDRNTPNRQNLLCSYTSTWEIIEKSQDYIQIENPSKNPNPMIVNVKKVERATHPLFHILLDRGPTLAPPSVINQIKNNLAKIFDANSQNMASLSIFPNDVADDPSYNQLVLDWQSLVSPENKLKFVEAINDWSLGGPQIRNRNFPRAIKEAVQGIKNRGHDPVGVLLIVKTGGGRASYENLDFEQEILGMVLETNIRIFAIEIFEGNRNPLIHLKSLVAHTNGFHAEIKSGIVIDDLLSSLNGQILPTLNSPIRIDKEIRMAFKGKIRTGVETEIPILTKEYIHIYFEITVKILVVNLTLSQNAEVVRNFEIKGEWDEELDVKRRFTYSYHRETDNSIRDGMLWKLNYECPSTIPEDCDGFVTVYGELDGSFAGQTTYSDLIDYTLTTSTLTDGKTLDLLNFNLERADNFSSFSVSPFSIYLKMEENEIPLHISNEISQVLAIITKLNPDNSPDMGIDMEFRINLIDDGQGTPDVIKNDGIFSGNFFPPSDGLYSIHSAIFYRESPTKWNSDLYTDTSSSSSSTISNKTKKSIKRSSKIISQDQLFIGCGSSSSGCEFYEPQERFGRIIDYPGNILFLNVPDYEARPDRILNLDGIGESNFEIFLSWTRPFILGGQSDDSVESRTIYWASTLEEILEGELLNEVDCDLGETIGPNPGDIETCRLRFVDEENTVYYFFVQANYKSMTSLSNIVRVETVLDFVPTTTTTTTPRPRPTPPTTEYTRPVTRSTTIRTTIPPTEETTSEKWEDPPCWFCEPKIYLSFVGLGAGLIFIGLVFFLYIRYCQGAPKISKKKKGMGLKAQQENEKWNKKV